MENGDAADEGVDLFESQPLYVDGVTLASGVENRGGNRAVFATRDIKAGELLMAEQPIVHWPEESGKWNLDIATIFSILKHPKKKERKHVLRELMGLHPTSLSHIDEDIRQEAEKKSKDGLDAIVKEYGDVLSREEALRLLFVLRFNGFASGVYLYLSIINHACKPNCIKHQPDMESASEIRATQDIKAGEEILICYLLPMEQMRVSRRRELKKQYLFDCDCHLCTTETPFIESFRCSIECDGEVPPVTGKCTKCGTEKKTDEAEEHATDIESRVESLESDAELFRAKRAKFRFRDALSLRSQAQKVLHPRHLVLARLHKMLVEVYGVEISGPCNDFDNSVVCFLEFNMELRKTQMLYLGKDHIDIAATMSDISQGIRTLLSCNQSLLFEKFPEWNTPEKASQWEGRFNQACRRIEQLYND